MSCGESASQDGQNSNPQVLLGLLVIVEDIRCSYSLFKRSQYEGYTMIPIVDDFVQEVQTRKGFRSNADAA